MFKTKQLARKKAKEARKAAYELAPNAAENLANNFDPEISPKGKIIAGYMPFTSEIDPRPLMRKLQSEGAVLALPRVNKKTLLLDFHRFDFDDELELGAFGIKEPFETAPIIEPDWLLVPLLAFDKFGFRLGYGGGYYDKAICRLRSKREIMTFGLAYSAQEIDAVPHESHDEKLDWIVTNDSAIRTSLEQTIIESKKL